MDDITKICLSCKHLEPCQKQFGYLSETEEDCRTIYGTHFCMGSWSGFINDNKK